MKTLYSSMLLLVSIVNVVAGEPISIEEFKKAKGADRQIMLDEAPPEQREGLKRLDTHLTIVDILRGEEGVKREKESAAARARGFLSLEALFVVQTQYWEDYVTGVAVANEKAGMAPNKRQAVSDRLYKFLDTLVERQSKVRLLVFNLAASPKALELDRRAGEICEKCSESLRLASSVTGRYITKQQMMTLDEEAGQIYSELIKLPSLTQEQAQNELNNVSDDFIFGRVSAHARPPGPSK